MHNSINIHSKTMDPLDDPSLNVPNSLNKYAKKKWFWIILLIIIAIFFIIGIIASLGGDDTSSSSSGLTENKTITVNDTTGALNGTIGLKPTNKGKILATYKLKLHTDLPTNWACKDPSVNCGQPTNEYTYISDLVIPGTEGDSEGSLSAIRCNVDQAPGDPFDTATSPYYSCESIRTDDSPTTYFYTSFSRSFDTYDSFLKATTFNVYDGSAYWQILNQEIVDGSTTTNFGVDADKALAETQPVKTFTLQIGE